jgi:replication fork protection complex subunit Tof1/Swi1
MDPWTKSETVDPEVRAYVYSLVNAVGGSSTYDNNYSIGDDALAVLKDLARWLKLYDEKTGRMDVKRCLAEANLVKGDLLEILALWSEDTKTQKSRSRLALACLELLVPLSWPLELDVEKATMNHHRHVPYLQLAQVGYKRAVLHHEHAKILRTVVRIVLPAMSQPRRDRSRRDEGIIKLGLYFFRNMAMITQPQTLPSQGDENEVSRSATIDAFHAQDVFTLLLTLGSNMGDEFKEQDVLLLEILFHLLKGVDPKKLFMKKAQLATTEINELQNLISREKAMHSSYKKHAPTRHNRFGTMIWVKRDELKVSTVSGQTSITDETSTLHQMDASKKFNKPRNRGKKAQDVGEQSEIGARIELTESAREHLKGFVEDFLDSSFNPLFASLRRAIESEADRLQETIHNKQYFYLISWFLAAEAARREQKPAATALETNAEASAAPEENCFAYIASVLDQETFVLLNRKMQAAFDNKEWQDLQATLMCFTQILQTVQNMSESKDEEDQEIAENILNRIFYEEATHDRMVQILRGYTSQGFAYLDAITECVHVFVRMLERYSKQNVDLQIRSKRRARKKAKAQTAGTNNEEDGDAAERAQDEQEAHETISERKFDFARFSAKFLSQPCVDTFIALLNYHADLSPAQLKRCHRYLYRLAFKHELSVMLFRVDILHLLNKLIKGPGGLPPASENFKEWEQLVQQIFRQCFKWMDRPTEGQGWKEAAVVEMLFSKIPNTIHYLQNGYEKVVQKRAPRPPAELEVKASVPEEQRVAVAVSIMIEQAKSDLLDWVKKRLAEAADERKAWEDAHANRNRDVAEGEPPVEIPESPTIFFVPGNDQQKDALFKDKHLRLLLNILGLQRMGSAEDVDASWVFPPTLTLDKLSASLEQIQKAEFDPPTFEGEKTASELIRSKAVGRRGAVFSDHSDDDNDSDGGILNDAMFPPNLKEKRRRKDNKDERPRKRRKRNGIELTEEELDERAKERRRKEKEKNAKIKSKLFVTESDDESDAEGDAEFFRQEAERRKKTAGLIREALLKRTDESDDDDDEAQNTSSRKKKSAPKKKASTAHIISDDEDEDMLDSDAEPAPRPTAKKSGPFEISDGESSSSSDDEDGDAAMPPASSDDEDENNHNSDDNDDSASDDDDRPPVSSRLSKSRASKPPPPLRELSSNAVTRTSTPHDRDEDMNGADDDDDDGDSPIKPVPGGAARRNTRAGFVIGDDSDDE